MDLSSLAQPIVKAFEARGVATVEGMRDDEKMRAVARFALELAPSPIRVGVRMTMGDAGFEAFILRLRDQMLLQLGNDLGQVAGRSIGILVVSALDAIGHQIGDVAGGLLVTSAISVVWQGRSPLPSGIKELAVGRAALIGRDPTCDIHLPDHSVSRKHARIEVSPLSVQIQDLGSTNGTLVAGRRVTTFAWPSGQPVTIGLFTLSHGPSEPLFNPNVIKALVGRKSAT
jgi:hypothetical protein